AEPDRLVMVWGQMLADDRTELPASGAELRDYREMAESLDGVAAIVNRYVNLTGEGQPERLVAARVSAGLFPMLGAEAAHGRTFLPEEDRRGDHRVAVLSDGLWRRRFGADPGIVGDKILLSDEPFTVVGVMPPDFELQFEAFEHELWIPVAIDWDNLPPRDFRGLRVLGRLAPGVGLEQARAEMDTIAARFQQDWPEIYPPDSGWGLRLVPLQEQIVGDVRPALAVLMGLVGLVLLIACTNVANLLLARAADRSKEVSIRAAVGAGRGDLLRQLLAESVLLAATGAVLGLLLAAASLRVLRAVDPADLPRVGEVGIDGGVLLFTLGVALLTGLLFGLVPALRASRPDLQKTLKEGGKTDAGAGGGRLRSALVVAEVALALVVLVGAGLMVRSFLGLSRVDPGFDPDHLLTAQLYLSPTRYPEGHQKVAYGERLLERLRSLPGVRHAGAVSGLPMSEVQLIVETEVEGDVRNAQAARPAFDWRPVSPGYFRALGISLVEGRAFDERDHAEAQPVAVVGEDLARRFWPGENPVGKRLKLLAGQPRGPEWRTVVGVVGHIRALSLEGGEAVGQVYTPMAQSPLPFFSVAVRTEGGDPLSLAPEVRQAVWSVDGDQPVENVRTMEQILAEAAAGKRGYALLLSVFAGVALVLAVVGVYGVMAYSVARRTQEIGLRMSLGAGRPDVLGLVVRQGTLLAAAGLVVGGVIALGSGRFLAGLLYGVSSHDPGTFAGVVLLLGGLAVLASLVPAYRATRVDPIVCLRAE
ncbi:MAG: ABC transporter permease, partial [Acidobacteriota bacterium]